MLPSDYDNHYGFDADPTKPICKTEGGSVTREVEIVTCDTCAEILCVVPDRYLLVALPADRERMRDRIAMSRTVDAIAYYLQEAIAGYFDEPNEFGNPTHKIEEILTLLDIDPANWA